MGLFLLYSVFALTTAIVSVLELLNPIMRDYPDYEHPYILRFVFFGLSILLAPFLFLSCIIPGIGQTFRENFAKGFFE